MWQGIGRREKTTTTSAAVTPWNLTIVLTHCHTQGPLHCIDTLSHPGTPPLYWHIVTPRNLTIVLTHYHTQEPHHCTDTLSYLRSSQLFWHALLIQIQVMVTLESMLGSPEELDQQSRTENRKCSLKSSLEKKILSLRFFVVIIFTDHVCSMTGRLCFYRCLSVHWLVCGPRSFPGGYPN